ncbi:MAG: hypothetical protein Q4E94_03810, partial [Clostridia bacterium]|nr:hypothetical protein [Clostridia bacterium]
PYSPTAMEKLFQILFGEKHHIFIKKLRKILLFRLLQTAKANLLKGQGADEGADIYYTAE